MRRLATATLIVFVSVPAYAQKMPPLNVLRNDAPDAYTQQRRKEIEDEYNAAMKKIPDRKKQSSDPWQKLRGSGEAKGQTAK
jgi:hypothetical protein